MNPRPIAFRNPELAALGNGLRHFRRLADGALKGVGPGDRLWIREPYFLVKRLEGFRPTEALHLGETPTFLADVGFRHGDPCLGRIRSARELCRPWHRRHLVIGSVRPEPLQAITTADLEAAGYRDVEHFAELWDRDVGMRGRGYAWHDNPRVLRCTFSLIDAPLPEADQVERRRRKPGPKPGKAAAERERKAALRRQLDRPRPAPVLIRTPAPPAADGRTWCDQCQRRVSQEEGRACTSPFCDLAPPRQEAA